MNSPRFAIVTPSYATDFNRCRLLCRSIQENARFPKHHYLIVESEDLALFKPLAGPDTSIVLAEDLLPHWLVRVPGEMRKWRGLHPRPVGGWVLQQLLKMLFAEQASEEIILFADSDMVFIRPCDASLFIREGKTYLLRVPEFYDKEFDSWAALAFELLGLTDWQAGLPRPNYVGNPVVWNAVTAKSMCRFIDETTGRAWIETLATRMDLSEYTLYGTYVDKVLGETANHFHDYAPLCQPYWLPRNLDAAGIGEVLDGIEEHHYFLMLTAKAEIAVSRYEDLLSGYL